MSYSLLDDSDWDDWERSKREADLLGTLIAPEDDPRGLPPLPEGPPPSLGPPEMAPLRDDPTAPDWTTAVSVGASGLGAILDLALNKGRGTGQILAAGAEGANRSADIRLRGREQAMQYEAKRAEMARANRYNDYLDRSLGARVQNQGAVNADRDTTLALRERSLNQGDQKLKQGGARLEQGKQRLEQGDRRLDQVEDLELAQNKAGAATRGRINATNELAPESAAADEASYRQLTPAHVDRAEQTARATVDEKAAVAGETAAARESATGAAEGRREQRTQSRMNKFRDETERTRPLLSVVQDIDSVMAKYPTDKPGAGMWDSWKSSKLSSEDDLKVNNARKNMTDLVARWRSGAAVPPMEFDKIERFVTAGDGATELEFRVAYDAFKRGLQNEIRQQAAGREDEARGILGSAADAWLGPRDPKLPGGVQQPPLQGVSMTPRPGSKSVGMTPTSQPVQPYGAAGGGGPVQATPLGDGTFTVPGGSRPYTAQEIDRLRAKGLVR